MSNRRKTRGPKPEGILRIPVDRADYNLAVIGFQTVRQCAACGGPARVVRRGSLLVNHIGDCPALTDPSLLMKTSGS